jgi:hypothetical protein
MKMAIFWFVAPCSLVCLHHQGLMMEEARISETLVNIYQTTRLYKQEDSHLLLTAVRTSNPTRINVHTSAL